MAGSVNTAAQRPQNVNITGSSIKGHKVRKAWRWRDGLTNNTGGGSYAPAVAFLSRYADKPQIRVHLGLRSEFGFVVAEAARDHVARFGAIVNVHNLNFLLFVAGKLFVAQKVVL